VRENPALEGRGSPISPVFSGLTPPANAPLKVTQWDRAEALVHLGRRQDILPSALGFRSIPVETGLSPSLRVKSGPTSYFRSQLAWSGSWSNP
jgi:hypothetical protein